MTSAPDTPEPTVTDNPDANRFELDLGDDLAVSEYMRVGGTVIFTHTEVPEAYEGQGIGSRLAEGALERVREQGLKVRSTCPFMTRYLAEHPEYRDLVQRSGPGGGDDDGDDEGDDGDAG